MTDIKKGKLSTDLSRLNQDADIDILLKIVKIIPHALRYNVCKNHRIGHIDKRQENL